MTELITTIITQEDAAARKKLITGLESIQAEQKKLSIAVAKGEIANEEYAKSFAKLNKESTTLKRALAPLEKEFKAQEKAILDAEKATRKQEQAFKEAGNEADNLDSRLERLDASFGKISTQVGQSGDIASGISGIGGAVSAIPGIGGAAGGIAGAGAGVFDLIEQLPRLKTAFAGLPDILQASAKGAGLGGLAGSLQSAVPALGATGASVAALTAVALPLIAAVGVLAVGLKELEKVNREAAEGAQQAAEARQIQADTEREFQDLAVDEQVAERNRLFEERANIAADITRENERLAELRRQVEESAPGEARLNGTRAAMNAQKEVVDGLIAQAADTGVALQAADDAIGDLTEAERQAANFRIAHAEEIERIEQDITDATNERLQAESKLEQGLQRLAQLEDQRVGLIDARAQAERFADETAALESKFAAEDQIAQEQVLRDTLSQIATDSLERIAAIDAEIGNLRVEREQALADVVSDGQDKLDKINGDYFKKTLADTRKFQKETERLEEDGKRARLQLIADITDRLNQAEADNNVLAFLQAQTEGAKQLKEQAQTAGEAERRRAEDFADAQQQAAEAQSQRVAETLAGIEAEKAQVIEAYNERRAELVATRDAEKVAAQEAQNQAIENYRAQEEREAQQAERQAEREALREQQDAIRFQQQLDAIEEQKQAQLAANHEIRVSINDLTTLAGNLQSRIAAANAQAQSSSSQSSSSSSSSSPFSGGLSYSDRARMERSGITAFASGGIADRPTLGLIAEVPGMSEAVIPFRNSEGLDASLARHGIGNGGKPSITLAPVFNNTIGDIASKSEVVEANRMTFQQLIILVEQALAGNS